MSWSDTGSISDYYQVGHCLWVFVYITSPLGLPKTPARHLLPAGPSLLPQDLTHISACIPTTCGFLVACGFPGCL